MDEQEFLESMEDVKGQTLDRIYGLLSGTNNEDDNVHQILDSLIIQTFGRAFIIGATEQRQGRVEFIEMTLDEMNPGYVDEDTSGPRQDWVRDTLKRADDEFKLGPCGCTDYHMADCPLRTG